jgi:hypothetical protein
MIECRQRPFDGRLHDFEVLQLGDSSPPVLDYAQLTSTRDNNNVKSSEPVSNDEEDGESGEEPEQAQDNSEVAEEETEAAATKKRKQDAIASDSVGQKKKGNNRAIVLPPVEHVYKPVARPITSMKGHTAFLTFAFAPTTMSAPAASVANESDNK